MLGRSSAGGSGHSDRDLTVFIRGANRDLALVQYALDQLGVVSASRGRVTRNCDSPVVSLKTTRSRRVASVSQDWTQAWRSTVVPPGLPGFRETWSTASGVSRVAAKTILLASDSLDSTIQESPLVSTCIGSSRTTVSKLVPSVVLLPFRVAGIRSGMETRVAALDRSAGICRLANCTRNVDLSQDRLRQPDPSLWRFNARCRFDVGNQRLIPQKDPPAASGVGRQHRRKRKLQRLGRFVLHDIGELLFHVDGGPR